jgi:twinkle protein
MSDDSTFVCKEPCPQCGSKDNLARYSDGHGHCFGCAYYEHGDGERASVPQREKKAMGMVTGEVRALAKRGINEETCRHWNYRVGEFKGRTVQAANYYDADGNVVAQKLRFPPDADGKKDFVVTGDLKKALPLYGQWLWRDGGKQLVITEGEIDALSVSQLQQNKWPVVSVPNGAQGAAKAIAKAIEWVERFDRVVFLLDNDEPGREAAKTCASLLSPGRAFIGVIPGFKDANAALQEGKGKLVIDAIWGAKEQRPDGVVSVDSLIDLACSPLVTGIEWPWPTLTEKTYGIRRKELYGYGGGTGVGKTTIFKEVELHLMEKGHKVGIMHLEEPPAHTLKVLAGMRDGCRYHVPGVEFDADKLRATAQWFDGKAFFYDHFGAMDFDTIREKMRYMVLALGCRDIFLDHLTALAASIDDDERKAIDKIMAELGTLVQQLDITIHYISHLATPEGKSHEEGGRVQERHFRGSRSIAYWSNFLFGLERDKQNTEGVTTFRVLKDRYTGDANGVTFGLAYDRERGRMVECELASNNPFKDGGEF